MDMRKDFGHTYLTAGLPGTGGRLKERPEDFAVEEVPLYEPAGRGEFAFLLVETVDLSTLDLVAILRRQLKLADHQVGLAGWKDRRALSRQWVSVPREQATERLLRQLPSEGVNIIDKKLHSHKLRTGHLLGNRFSVLVREPKPDAETRARNCLQHLQAEGLPNFYGRQRFGTAGDNPEKGLALLQGKLHLRSVRKRKLLISACTSLLFNLTLKERLEKGLFGRLLQGDVAKKHDTGGMFLVSDPAAEQVRADRLEISATGPIWGRKMKRAADEADSLETEILSRQGLTPELFHKQTGSRRPLRVTIGEVGLRREPEGLRLEFFLPKGSYATVLLEEIMKVSAS